MGKREKRIGWREKSKVRGRRLGLEEEEQG